MIDKKVLGGILLIAGTSIGAGMLALPITLARAGFYTGLVFLLASWVYMTFCAFLLLEANLRLPRYSNYISMVHATLGRPMEWFSWSVYLFLLYTLLSAYISGGTDLIDSILNLLHVYTPTWLDALLFVLVLGTVIGKGIGFVDASNKFLMIFKFALYFVLFGVIVCHVDIKNFTQGMPESVVYALPILVTAFGFSVIIPSLRSYFEDDLKKLRTTIIVGSLIPLIVYILWIAAILGTIPREGDRGLMAILGSAHEVSYLALRLQESLNNVLIGDLFRAFSTISLLTSFLGVGLSLTDFLSDGFSLPKKGWRGFAILVLTFLPPLTVVWLNPSLFILGLNYAGMCVVILFGLLPVMMVWVGRYVKHQRGYQVVGGRPALMLAMTASLVIIIFGIKQLSA